MLIAFGERHGPSNMGNDTYWQYEVFIQGRPTGLKIWGVDEVDAAQRLVDVAKEGFLFRITSGGM